MEQTARQVVESAVGDAVDRAHALADLVGEMVKPRLRGVLHEVAFAVSLVTGTALVCLAAGAGARTAAVVYAVSVALLFGTSAAYHRGTWSPRAERLLARLDHSIIFVLIAGTYTPFALLLPGPPGRARSGLVPSPLVRYLTRLGEACAGMFRGPPDGRARARSASMERIP